MRKWLKHPTARKALIALAVSVCGLVTFTFATEDPVTTAITKLEKEADLALSEYPVTEAEERQLKKDEEKELAEQKQAAANAKKFIKTPPKKQKPGNVLDLLRANGNPDKIRALNDIRVTKLIQEMQKAKDIVEAEAEKRKDKNIYKDSDHKVIEIPTEMATIIDAMKRYLYVQKRLYKNLLRNAHQTAGEESKYQTDKYDYLDIKVDGIFGNALSYKDQYGLIYNIWHIKDEKGGYDKMEMGLTPQDKAGIQSDDGEEGVLRERLAESHNEKDYAKLIHFLTLRQRVTNQWAIQRLSTQRVILDPQMEACGENLVSFGYSSYGQRNAYYTALKKEDESLMYNDRLKAQNWFEITSNRPVIDPSVEKTMHKEFVTSLPSYKENINKIKGCLMLQSTLPDADAEKVFFADSLSLNSLAEEDWSKPDGNGVIKAYGAIKSVSYSGDSYYREDVADRIAWIAYKTRLKNYATQLKLFAIGLCATEGMKDEDVQKRADAFVAARLAPLEKPWRKKLAAEIEKTYFSDKSSQVERTAMNQRFEKEVFEKLWPVIQSAAQADKALKNVADVTSAKCVSWTNNYLLKNAKYQDSKTCVAQMKDYDLAYIPAKGNLTERVYPWNPEQLKAFFEKKWAFWEDHYDTNFKRKPSGATHTAASIKLAKTVKDAIHDKKVVDLFNKFFGLVTKKYNDKLQALKINPLDVGPGSRILADVIPAAVSEISEELDDTVEKIDPKVPQVKVDKSAVLVTVSMGLLQQTVGTGKKMKPLVTEDELYKEVRDITLFKTDLVRKRLKGNVMLQQGITWGAKQYKREGIDAIAELGETYDRSENLLIVQKLAENPKYAAFFKKNDVIFLLKLAKLELMKIQSGKTLLQIATLIVKANYATDAALLKEIQTFILATPALAAKYKSHPASKLTGLEAIAELGEFFTPLENFQIIDKLDKNHKYFTLFDDDKIEVFLDEARKLAIKPPPPKPLYDYQPQRAVIDNVAPKQYWDNKARMRYEEQQLRLVDAPLNVVTVHHFADNVRQLLALFNFSDTTTGKHTFPPKGKWLNERPTTPRELESVLNDQGNFESDLYGQITRSVLDQKMMAQVIYEMSITTNPLLAVTEDNKTLAKHWALRIGKDIKDGEAPPALDLMVARYWQGSTLAEKKANARLGVLAAIDIAARNVLKLRPVEEACYAKPFKRGHILGLTEWSNDERWRNLFSTSQAYRQLLQTEDKNTVSLDKKVSDFSDTAWESISHDILSPINQAVGQIFIYALIIAAAGALIIATSGAGTALLASTGSVWSSLFATGGWAIARQGALEAFASIGVSSTATASMSTLLKTAGSGMLKVIFNTTAGHIFNALFFAELGLSGFSMYYHLPAQLEYRMGINSSQIGYHAGAATTRKDIMDFVSEIHQGRVAYKTTLKVTAAFFSLPVFIKAVQIRSTYGFITRAAAGRQMAVEGAERMVTEGNVITVKQYTDKYGPIVGRWEYVKDALKAKDFYGRVTTLSPDMPIEELNRLASNNVLRLVQDPKELVRMYVQRLKSIKKEVERLRAVADKIRGSKRTSTATELAVAGYHGQYYKIAMDNATLKILKEEAAAGAETATLTEAARIEPGMNGVPKLTKNQLHANMIDAYADSLDLMVKFPDKNVTINANETASFEYFMDTVEEMLTREETAKFDKARDAQTLVQLLAIDKAQMNESTYLMRQALEMFMDLRNDRMRPVEIMVDHIKKFEELDWIHHGRLMSWVVKNLDKEFMKEVSANLSTSAKDLKKLNQIFKDYKNLMIEIKMISDKMVASFPEYKAAADKKAEEKAKEKNRMSGEQQKDANKETEEGPQWKFEPGNSQKDQFKRNGKTMNTEMIDEAEFEDLPGSSQEGSVNGDPVEVDSYEQIEVTTKDGKNLEWRIIKQKKPGFRWFRVKAS